jgi:hypothetical protein
LFHTGSAHGIHPSERSPPGRYPGRFRPEEPTYCYPSDIPNPDESGWGRRGRTQFLGFDPSRSPWRAHVCLARDPLDAPLGFGLLGLVAKTFTGISPSVRSHAYSNTFRHRHGVSAYRSASASTRPSAAANRHGLEEQPLQAFCTGRLLNIQTPPTRAMCSPRHATRITANLRDSLDDSSVLPELSGC